MHSDSGATRPASPPADAAPSGISSSSWKRRIAPVSVRSARQSSSGASHGDPGAGLQDDIVDLVTRMFKNILQDDRIPAQIRLLFARLHVVVMRIALAEPRAFAENDHPARGLVSLMESCVMGFEGDRVADSDLEKAIKQVVLLLEQSSIAGQSVFEQVYRDFKKFLASAQTGEDTRPQTLMSDMDTVPMPLNEDRAAFVTEYASWITDTLKGLSVRPEVLSFLSTVWVDVLAMTAFYRGRHHAETIAFKKTVIEMIWLSGAKKTRRSRARVIGEVQALLQHLRTGMTLLGLTFDQQKIHLDAISTSMVDAFLATGKRSGTPATPVHSAQPHPPVQMCPVHEHDLQGLDVSEHESESVWSLFDDGKDGPTGKPSDANSRSGPPSVLMPDVSFVWSRK